jgi:hypothetical protein
MLMTDRESKLYSKICEFQLDDPAAVYKLSTKLAWEYHWTEIYTLRAIHEYKKFVFLATIQAQIVSPSTTIDRVWHQHLLYTHSYWQDFCGEVLKKPLHHYPGGGGTAELARDRQRYQSTLELYQSYFGEPPTDIWDSPPLQSNHLAHHNCYWQIPNPIYWLKSYFT